MLPVQIQLLADHVWQSTFFAVVAGAMTLAFRNNRAQIRYGLWLAATVKFLIPFSVLLSAGSYFSRHSMLPAAPSRLPAIAGHFTESFFVSPSTVMTTTSPPPTFSANLILTLLGMVWAIGFIVLTSSWFVRWRRVRAALRTASPVQLPINLKAMSSPAFIEPGVFGIYDPILLVPEGIKGGLTQAQLEAILMHEMCHVRRRDNLTTSIHMAVEALFWFHPLVWFLGARLMEERERACDEEVLRAGNEPYAYAEGVLKICELYLQSPLRCMSGVTGSNLKMRIQEILRHRVPANLNFGKKLCLTGIGILVVVLPIMLGVLNAQAPSFEVVSIAQNFTGTWQGGLKVPQAPNGEVRIVIKIDGTEKDNLTAEVYSIDQTPTPFRAESVKTNGQKIKVNIPTVNLTYEGTLSNDGSTINGTWNSGEPRPLMFVKATPSTAWAIPTPPPPPKMMDAKAKPQFEVATIKPSGPNQSGWGMSVNPSGILNAIDTTLADLVKFCYDMHSKQVVNAPAWFDTEKFDITAKPDTLGMASLPQMKAMVQQLLRDRFGLKFHNDKREMQAYAITVAKGGEKIKKEETAMLPLPIVGGSPQRGLTVRNAMMADFASVLQAEYMDLPVIDQTNLGDTRYTFTVKFNPDPTVSPIGGATPTPGQPSLPDADAPPDLYSAMEQELGLRIQKTRTNVLVMVIDKVEKPSEN